MYNMMTNSGWGSSLTFFWGLHVFSIIVFGFGVALLLFWAFKHLPEHALWKWGWGFVVVGTILCLLTISAWPSFGMGRFGYGFGSTAYGMMPGTMWGGNTQASDDGAQAKEEADGKALYEKLQTKQAGCQDLRDSDFELIGEYVMGQMAGASHDQMNAMMKQMMGTDGEEQMHIIMGKRLSGCVAGVQPIRGMMNGGGMMGQPANGSPQPGQVDPHHSSTPTP